MKKFFLVLTFFLFSTTSLFAEYRLEPVNCTLKKKITVELTYITQKLAQLIFAIPLNVKKY